MASRPSWRPALERAASHSNVHVLPVPSMAARISIFDFKETRRLIRAAYAMTVDWLGQGQEQEREGRPSEVHSDSLVPQLVDGRALERGLAHSDHYGRRGFELVRNGVARWPNARKEATGL